MQAWLVNGTGAPSAVLERVERPAPEVGPGLLRARVHAAGCGLPDVLMCRGSYPLTPPRPFTPGQEIAGEVLEVGPGGESRVGERIMGVTAFPTGFGGFADEALVYDHFALPIPTDMSDEQAAAFSIPYHTAWVGLVRRAALAPKETLLVLGASGGTGSAAVQLGRALGARVIATAGGPDKLAFCRSLGADEVIDHRCEDVAERVRELTGGTGAEVIYDPVGGDAYEAARRCIASEGRLCVVGFASGDWGRPSAAHMATQNYSVVGVMPSGYDRAFRLDAHARMTELFARGELRPPVEVRPTAELPQVLEALAARQVRGKRVVI